MKNLLFICLLALTVFSCSKDDDGCSSADWVGTYSGIINCDGENEELSVTITEGADGAIVFTEDGDSDTFTPNGCTISESEDTGFGIITTEYTLDGNNLNLKLTGDLFGVPFNCSTTLTK